MSRWGHFGPAAAIAAALFAVYALGACRTIYVGDSGELVAAVDTLGIPHPTGYPLYVLLGKLWTLLVPVGSIAFRMSLFSAACAALAAGGVYWIGRRLGLGGLSALTSALLLAFSPSFWSQANVQRVYSLNALALVAALGFAVAWRRDGGTWRLAVAFGLAGLGAANHTYMGVFAIAMAGWAWVAGARSLRVAAYAGGAFAAGLLPYLYLPLRSRMNPRLDWGNPETLDSFLDVLTRADMWNRAWLAAPSDLVPIGLDYLGSFGRELLWAAPPLVVIGLVLGRRRGWPVGLLAAAMAVNFVAMALHGSRPDIFIWHRYYIPSYLVAALVAGLGLEVVLERLPRRLAPVALALPLTLLVIGWAPHDRSRYRIAEDFSRQLLAGLPPGSHLTASDDNILFVLIYLHMVEDARPDVNLILQGVGGADLPPLRFDPDSEPLYMTHHPNWNVPGLAVVPVGLVFRTVTGGAPLPPPVLPSEWLDGELDPRVPRDYLTQNLIGHFHYMLGVTFEERDWLRAQREFARATEAAARNDVLWYNLGLIYSRNGLLERARAAFERAEAIDPRGISGNPNALAGDRVAELEAELGRLRPLAAALAAELTKAGLAAGSPEWHREMARLLAGRGEALAARGELLLAEEASAPPPG